MRISTNMINTNAIAQLQNAQSELAEAQRQTASQTKADDMKGYGRNAQTIVSSQRMIAKAEGYIGVATELNTRMAVQDTAIDRAATALADLRQTLTEALALDNANGVQQAVNDAYRSVRDSFNLQVNGRYVFGGTRNDVAPIQTDTLTDLAANPLANAFTPDADEQIIRIEDNLTVRAGPLGADAANEAMAIFKRLEEFHIGVNGPFDSNMDDTKRATLTAEIGALATAAENMVAVQAENGQQWNAVETAITRQESRRDTLLNVTSDLSTVDLAEVALRLSNAQTQFQATASVFNTIRGLSLIDYLR